jgi:hypothetical protein
MSETKLCSCGGDPYHKEISIYICYNCYWDEIFKKPLSDDARFIALRTKKLDGLPPELKRNITNEIKKYSKQSPGTFISSNGTVVRRCEDCNKIIMKGNCLMNDYKTICFRCAFAKYKDDDGGVCNIQSTKGMDDYECHCMVCVKYKDDYGGVCTIQGIDDYDEGRCMVCANNYVDCVCSKSTPSKQSGVTSPSDLSDFDAAYKEQHEIPNEPGDDSDLSSYDSSDESNN